MREVQTFGRYVLYAVLFVLAFAGLQDQPGMQWTLLLSVIFGVPGYWFWSLHVHARDHLDRAREWCWHCRNRESVQRRRAREAEMERLNREFRDRF